MTKGGQLSLTAQPLPGPLTAVLRRNACSPNPSFRLAKTVKAAERSGGAVCAHPRQRLAFVPNLFRLWANAPHLLPTLVQMETTICGSGKVPARLKELAAYRTSELNGCRTAPPSTAQRQAAIMTPESAGPGRAGCRATPEASLFSEDELAVLALADEMTRQVNARPETLDRIRALFGVDGTVELMATIALLNFT